MCNDKAYSRMESAEVSDFGSHHGNIVVMITLLSWLPCYQDDVLYSVGLSHVRIEFCCEYLIFDDGRIPLEA